MSNINVLGICASTRVGNSEFLLRQALEAAESTGGVNTTFYSLRTKKIAGCVACGYCGSHSGECALHDDFQELNDLWLKADAIIYSVPVYHMGMPGQLKCFIDRLGNSAFGRFAGLYPKGEEKLPRLNKAIGAISNGIHIFSGQEHTMTQIINHAMLMQCIPVTGDMWECYIGSGAWTSGDPSINAIKNQMDRDENDACLSVKGARSLGIRVAETAKIICAGMNAKREELESDVSYSVFYSKE